MSYLTRDERIALQDEDDGDPDDTVHAKDGTKVTHYHDDPGCRTLREPDQDMSRAAA